MYNNSINCTVARPKKMVLHARCGTCSVWHRIDYVFSSRRRCDHQTDGLLALATVREATGIKACMSRTMRVELLGGTEGNVHTR